jgi:hypothetical protein
MVVTNEMRAAVYGAICVMRGSLNQRLPESADR